MLSVVGKRSRPGKLRKFDRAEAIRLRHAGYSLRAIGAVLGVPMRTIYDCVVGIACPTVGKTYLSASGKLLKLKEPPTGRGKYAKE
jgi:hypothetical protein